MMNSMLCGASALALVATAQAADHAKNDAAPARSPATEIQTEATPAYAPQDAAIAAQLTAADIATKEDARQFAESEFLRADVNVDGALNKAEFSSLAAGVAGTEPDAGRKSLTIDAAFAKFSKGDAKITMTELVDARAKSFEEADVNRDLTLDAKENQKFSSLIAMRAISGAKPK